MIILGQYILLIQSELIELSEVELNKESRWQNWFQIFVKKTNLYTQQKSRKEKGYSWRRRWGKYKNVFSNGEWISHIGVLSL